MPPVVPGSTVGERIALARKVAGLSQQALAQRANYSTSMVRAVEQGREPASAAFVAVVSRALGIEIEELYGQPYRELLDDDGGVPGLTDLRTLFAEGNYAPTLEPGSIVDLETNLERIRVLRRTDRARQAISQVPVLLRQLRGAIEQATGDAAREQAAELLAKTYANTAQIVCRFGWITLASQAVDRMEVAAERSANSLLLAHAAQQRCMMLLACPSYSTGEVLVERSMELLATQPDSEAVLALRGSAHLRGAIIAARVCEADRAREHIAEARRIAARLGRSSSAYDTNFGPGNVEIHDVAVSLETGDPGRAAREGSALRIPADTPANRVGHHWQDVARAWVLDGNHMKALQALNNARKAAPQQTRYHPQVHETVRAIAHAERRKSDSVAQFTHWLGVRT